MSAIAYRMIVAGILFSAFIHACTGGVGIPFLNQHEIDPVIVVGSQVPNLIDPNLFGQFMERPSWGGEMGAEAALQPETRRLQPRAQQLIRDMHIPIVRFPGGTDVDYLDWTEMIDNVPGRNPNRPFSVRRGKRIKNDFGYDEFLRLYEGSGTDVIIVVNFRDGLLDIEKLEEAALQAAKLVAYCNAPEDADLPYGLGRWAKLRAKNGRPEPYRVKYFQIGNETWLFRNAVTRIAKNNWTGYWVKCLRAYIEAMRTVDPTIRIIIDGYPLEVAARVHKEFGDKIFCYALHRYYPWIIDQVLRDGKSVAVDTLTVKDIWRCWVTVPTVNSRGQSFFRDPAIDQARKLDYKIGLTEWNWNGWWTPGKSRPSANLNIAKGIGAASFLHAIMKNGDVIRLGCQSILIGNSWGITSIRVDPKARRPAFMMPIGLVMMLYTKYHGDRRLAVKMTNMPIFEQPYRMGRLTPAKRVAVLDVVATRNDRSVFVHIVNRRFETDQPVSIDLSDLNPRGDRAKLYVLESRLNEASEDDASRGSARIRYDTLSFTDQTVKLILSPQTVAIVEIPLNSPSP